MKLSLSANISKLRKEHAMTQEQLAEALGVTFASVSKWERGVATPELNLIAEMADLFEVSIDALIGYQFRNNNRETVITRLKQYSHDRDTEDVFSDVEKALQCYPNCFDVVYYSARIYRLRGLTQKNAAYSKKALSLCERACILIGQNKDSEISDVSVRDVQNAILDAKGYLLPYLDVPVSDVKFASYQRIGSTGILKGVGKNVDWSNQTWLRADTVLLASELDGLFEVYPAAKDEFKKTGADKLSIEEAVQLVQKIAETEKLHTTVDPQALWKAYGMQEPDLKRNILRGEMAVMIDQVLDPFNKKQIDITGKYIQ